MKKLGYVALFAFGMLNFSSNAEIELYGVRGGVAKLKYFEVDQHIEAQLLLHVLGFPVYKLALQELEPTMSLPGQESKIADILQDAIAQINSGKVDSLLPFIKQLEDLEHALEELEMFDFDDSDNRDIEEDWKMIDQLEPFSPLIEDIQDISDEDSDIDLEKRVNKLCPKSKSDKCDNEGLLSDIETAARNDESIDQSKNLELISNQADIEEIKMPVKKTIETNVHGQKQENASKLQNEEKKHPRSNVNNKLIVNALFEKFAKLLPSNQTRTLNDALKVVYEFSNWPKQYRVLNNESIEIKPALVLILENFVFALNNTWAYLLESILRNAINTLFIEYPITKKISDQFEITILKGYFSNDTKIVKSTKELRYIVQEYYEALWGNRSVSSDKVLSEILINQNNEQAIFLNYLSLFFENHDQETYNKLSKILKKSGGIKEILGSFASMKAGNKLDAI